MEALSVALTPRLLELGARVTTLTSSACYFMPGFFATNSGAPRIIEDTPCDLDYQQRRLAAIQSNPDSIVIMGGAFSLYLENDSYGFEPQTAGLDLSDGYVEAVKNLLSNGHFVMQLAPFLEFPENVSQSVLRRSNELISTNAARREDGEFSEFEARLREVLAYPQAAYLERAQSAFATFSRVEDENYVVVPTHILFCDTLVPETCLSNSGRFLYFQDQLHPARVGSEMLADLVIEQLEAASRLP